MTQLVLSLFPGIGNGVPFAMGQAVARAVAAAITEDDKYDQEDI